MGATPSRKALYLLGLLVLTGCAAPANPAPAAAPVAVDFPALPSAVELRSSSPSPSAVSPSPSPFSRSPAAATPTPSRTVAPAAPAPVVDLVIGTTVGLEVAGQPGTRLRHRDFRARVDTVGTTSSDLDRADSRFTVRTGLADPSCVSLEAVNVPGRFLRHENFVVVLDPLERTPLFAADATFCVVPRKGGTRISLRSVNYPDRFVTVDRRASRLTETAVAGAAEFIVRPPL